MKTQHSKLKIIELKKVFIALFEGIYFKNSLYMAQKIVRHFKVNSPSFFKISCFLLTIFCTTTNYSQTIWNGTSSTDWSDPSNWSTASVPNNTIDVVIPNALSNYPVLSAISNCRELTINSGASLDMNGFRFTIKQSFINNGTFENNGGTALFRINSSSGSYSLGGFSDTDIRIVKSGSSNYTITGNIDCKAIKLNSSNSGSIILDGQDVTISDYFLIQNGVFQIKSGSFTSTQNTSSTTINSGFNINGGMLDIDGGTVSFGLVTSTTADLNVNGGIVDVSAGVLNVSDELDVVSGTLSQTGGTINIRNYSGSAEGSAEPKFEMLAGSLNLINGTLNILGQNSNVGNYSILVASAVSVNSTANHTINITTNNSASDEDRYIDLGGNSIGNLTFDQLGHELYLTNNLSISGGLTVTAGTFDIQANSVNVSGSTSNDGVLKIGLGTLDTEGDYDATNGFTTFYDQGRMQLAGTAVSFGVMTTTFGTVEYDGGNQDVLADTYFNLEIDGSGTKTLPPNSFTINGDLSLSSGTLTYNSSANKSMSVKGSILGTGNITSTVANILNLNGNGTLQSLRGVSSDFIGIRFSGAANVITTGNLSCKYLDLMPGSTGSFTIDGETVSLNPTNGYLQLDGGNLIVSSGSLINNSTSQTNNYVNSGTLTVSGGTVEMTGNNGASGTGGDLNVNGGAILVSSGILSINDELDVANGIITQTGGEIYVKANSAVGWNGTLDNKFDMDAGTLTLSGGVLSVQAQATSAFNCIDIEAGVIANIGTGHTISISQTNSTFADDSYLRLNGNPIGNLTINLNGKTAFFRETPVIEGALTVIDGILNFENFDATVNGSTTINGILKFGNGDYDFNGDFDASGGGIDFNANGNLYVSASNPLFGDLDNILGNIVLDGTSLQTINQALTFSTFSINNPNGINLLAPLEVSTSLTLNTGIIFVSSPYSVKLLSTCNIVGTPNINSHISGALLRDVDSNLDYIFPVGDGTLYRPVVLTPEGSTASTFSVTYNNTAHSSISYDQNGNNNTPCEIGLDHVSGGNWWDISRESGSENCYVGINWDANSGVDSPNNIRLSHWTGSEWENLGEIITGFNGTGVATNSAGRVRSNLYVSSFSPFNLGSVGGGGNALPIELLSFNASCYQNSVLVEFSVLSQINNEKFFIERSTDAITWEVIGELDGAEGGNSNTQVDYVFTDNNPLGNLSYYRLTQVDFDGKSKEFLPVYLSCDSYSEGIAVHVFPNPACNDITIEMTLDQFQGDDVSYAILDASGKVVRSNSINLNKGFNKTHLNIGELSNGLYLLRFQNSRDYIKEYRLIKR
jgi:hypothetical protein